VGTWRPIFIGRCVFSFKAVIACTRRLPNAGHMPCVRTARDADVLKTYGSGWDRRSGIVAGRVRWTRSWDCGDLVFDRRPPLFFRSYNVDRVCGATGCYVAHVNERLCARRHPTSATRLVGYRAARSAVRSSTVDGAHFADITLPRLPETGAPRPQPAGGSRG